MKKEHQSFILNNTAATAITSQEIIQELWSGYGKIIRVRLQGSDRDSVVVKLVQLPNRSDHPRGWNSDFGHQRKVKSYQVEMAWYQRYAKNSKARLPQCLAIETEGDDLLLLLEDLNAAGYNLRKRSLGWDEIRECLQWLAQFHASYISQSPRGLWPQGTYWHLETRPEELGALSDSKLREAAPHIDQKLRNCQFKTFVHGDAKVANFCFSDNGQVAGLDFQYVGGGCGMKDVAYFVGSCLSEKDCGRMESKILDTYFAYLQEALPEENEALELEWRALYRVAWADFHRFLKGWSPGHWKINSYSERVTQEVINAL